MEFNGECYCGSIRFVVSAVEKTYKSLYCHCQSCRRAHSSPLYQICYIPHQCFRITAGSELITEYSRPQQGAPIRAFCKVCGSKIYNKLPAQPELGTGFFPALLESKVQHNLPSQLKPTLHYLSHQSVIDLKNLHDQLDRK